MQASTLKAQSALIVGATGAVGKHLLKELLNAPHFTRVGEFGRRTTEGLEHSEKLVQRTVDFEKLSDAGLTDDKWDVVFITLGTTRKAAGSAEQWIKIDQNYVVDVAKAAKHPQGGQRLVYISSAGANPKSSFLYPKSKGQTESRLASLGYADTLVFRPGMLLAADRAQAGPSETVAEWIINPLTAISSSLGINVTRLARAMRIAGELGSTAIPQAVGPTAGGGTGDVPKYTIISNKGSLKLADEK